MKHPIRFTVDDAQKAGETWGFNCGPAALCSLLNLTPDEIRPKLGDFERKGYIGPSLMHGILAAAQVHYRQTYRGDDPHPFPFVDHGLVRIQWGGPWCKPGVPMRVRYGHTHWVAMRDASLEVFDINATCVGGWMPFAEWHDKLVPWLCRQVHPRWDGTCWPTHVLEITTP